MMYSKIRHEAMSNKQKTALTKNVRYGMVMATLSVFSSVYAVQNPQGYYCVGRSSSGVCDATLKSPAFPNLCIAGIEFGTYVLTNHTPVTLKLNYIRIANYDGLPNAAAVIRVLPVKPV